jgi:hypothetical protein
MLMLKNQVNDNIYYQSPFLCFDCVLSRSHLGGDAPS